MEGNKNKAWARWTKKAKGQESRKRNEPMTHEVTHQGQVACPHYQGPGPGGNKARKHT